MLNRHWRVLVIALIMSVAFTLHAQMKTEGVALGLGGGVTIGDTDFGRDNEVGISFNPYLRHALAGPLEGQISGLFYGSISRDDADAYQTDVTAAIDYRLLLRLFSADAASLYIYGGFGGLRHSIVEGPSQIPNAYEEEGWNAYVPAGAGLQFRLTEKVSFDLSGGYFFGMTDDWNAVRATGDADDKVISLTDNDGIFNARAGLTWTRESSSADSDGDGLTNGEEKEIGTDKNMADSDGDGLSDGEEFRRHMTDPLQMDTDGDGLDDNAEVNKHSTNPRKSDSDDDGLSDKDEVTVHNTNAMKADSDGDGLGDAAELNTHKTDAMNADTDGDGLSDGDEVNTHGTDAKVADTDSDGLNDRAEVMSHKTNPNKVDTDGGSTNDGVEVNRGTNPLNPDDDVILEVEEGAPIVLDGVNFASGKSDITAESAAVLEKAYNTLVAYSDMVVEIRGYTDASGSRSGNIRLSQRRADSVRQWLITRGVDAGRIVAKGYGPDNPIATNDTAEGRAKNRRIEFYRTK